MKRIKIIALCLCAAFTLTACTGVSEQSSGVSGAGQGETNNSTVLNNSSESYTNNSTSNSREESSISIESSSNSSGNSSVPTSSTESNSNSLTNSLSNASSGSQSSTSSAGETSLSTSASVPTTNPTEDRMAKFDFENKHVLLNSGYYMPLVGLGTYALADDVCVNSVNALLDNGGRLIDTASFYGTEDSVGEAVRNSSIPREEIFVTTKLYPNQFANAAAEIDKALEETGLDYIDLMLLHHPGSHDVEAYKALEQAVKDGKIRSIGLSNWYIEELEEFLPQVDIMPAVVQNEIHPYYQENDVIPYIQKLGIVVEGWFPFGGRGHTKEILGDKVITDIANAHGVTSAQVILRWNLQKGVIVIPGSSNPDHIKENLDVFGFELTADEISKINALNRDEKHEWY